MTIRFEASAASEPARETDLAPGRLSIAAKL